MGFGLLFIGYFIATIPALAFPEIAGFTGFALISIALMSLIEYDRTFGYALAASLPLTLITFLLTVGYVTEIFAIPPIAFFEWVDGISDVLINALKLVFHVTLAIGVYNIAKDTGADKLCFPARRNMAIYTACYLIDLSALFLADIARYLIPIGMILYLVVIILYLVMIFSAYMRICDEKDVDMELKKTNIGWYDKLMEKTAEKEQQAADSTAQYIREKREANRKKQEAKRKKKK